MTPEERIAKAPRAWIVQSPYNVICWDTLAQTQEMCKVLYNRFPRSALSGERIVPVALVELKPDE